MNNYLYSFFDYIKYSLILFILISITLFIFLIFKKNDININSSLFIKYAND